MAEPDILEAADITVVFGGVQAVSGVSLSLGRNEILGLVGPNGSGKTTFLNAISGVVPAQGHLQVDGRPVRLGRPGLAWSSGIARVFQAPQVFDDLTCLEDVMLSSADRRRRGIGGTWFDRPGMWRTERERSGRAVEAMARVGLGGVADLPVKQLTYGQRRLLELARALNGQRILLLLDEPSAGLNEAETIELGRLLGGLRASGLPLMIVDHKIDFLTGLCDRVAVLELGELIAEGPPELVWRNERVRRAYLGV